MKSKVSDYEEESLLEVCVRWSHVQIIEYLLLNVKWKKVEIELAFKQAVQYKENAKIEKMLKGYSRKKYGPIYAICKLTKCLICCLSSKVTP